MATMQSETWVVLICRSSTYFVCTANFFEFQSRLIIDIKATGQLVSGFCPYIKTDSSWKLNVNVHSHLYPKSASPSSLRHVMPLFFPFRCFMLLLSICCNFQSTSDDQIHPIRLPCFTRLPSSRHFPNLIDRRWKMKSFYRSISSVILVRIPL